MVDRDGRQVLMCTWGKKSMEDEMDFTMFGDFNNGNLVDINVCAYVLQKFSHWFGSNFQIMSFTKNVCFNQVQYYCLI